MIKYTFLEVFLFICKVSKHLSLIIRTINRKTKMGDINHQACYRLNFKPMNWVICEKPLWRMKSSNVFETKKSHKLETLKCIFEKTLVLIETSWLKNCGNFLICYHKNWESFHPKGSIWKAQISNQQTNIIRLYW